MKNLTISFKMDKMLKIMIFKESSEEIFRDQKKIVVQTKMNDEKK